MKLNRKSVGTLWRVYKDYVKHHPWAFSLALLCILFTVLANIFAPLTLQAVTRLVEEGIRAAVPPAELYQQVILTSIGMLSAYVLGAIGSYGYSQINAVAGQTYMDELRKKVFNHMEDLPIRYFDQHDTGDIMSVYINDIDTVRQFIIQALPETLICLFTIVTCLTMMFITSVYLALFAILALSVMLFAIKNCGARSGKNFIKQQEYLGSQEGYVEEMMNGLKVVKSFCHEEEAKKSFDSQNEKLFEVSDKAQRDASRVMPILGNIGNIAYCVVLIVGVLFYSLDISNVSIRGVTPFDVAVLVSFLPLMRQLAGNFANISSFINVYSLALGGTARVLAIIDEAIEVDNGYVRLVRGKYDEQGNIVECGPKEACLWAWKHPHSADSSVTYTLLEGDIRMFDVDFSYDGKKTVLHDVSLYAKPGQRVAFVGATGAGKTTITNLLNRFYDIADGKVRYDGINVNKISKKDLRASLGMVLQDTNLFTGTIMDNIRYGRLDATDEDCIAAARLANADSFIRRLPNGYQTMLENDGNNLSQGQRQLLSIARAAVHDAPVMILDEATSSIDTRTEAIVTAGMDNLMKGRTVFVIAHRLSTIRNCDVIMVLDHGHIIERGSHEELIEKKGYYSQLYTGSFQLE